jgi:hypothetical protein
MVDARLRLTSTGPAMDDGAELEHRCYLDVNQYPSFADKFSDVVDELWLPGERVPI